MERWIRRKLRSEWIMSAESWQVRPPRCLFYPDSTYHEEENLQNILSQCRPAQTHTPQLKESHRLLCNLLICDPFLLPVSCGSGSCSASIVAQPQILRPGWSKCDLLYQYICTTSPNIISTSIIIYSTIVFLSTYLDNVYLLIFKLLTVTFCLFGS